MKYYLYDEKTKQFLKEQEGYLDPLETKAQGKNVYIVPPFSTTEKPDLTSLKDNEILVFNGNKWQIEQEFYVGKIVDCQGERAVKYVTDNDLTFEPCDNGFKIVEKPLPKEKTLEELKEQKHAELKSIMQTRAAKIDEINTSKNYQLNTGGLEYEEDLFAYDGPSAYIRHNFRLAGSDLPRHRSAGGHHPAVDLKGKPRTPAQL